MTLLVLLSQDTFVCVRSLPTIRSLSDLPAISKPLFVNEARGICLSIHTTRTPCSLYSGDGDQVVATQLVAYDVRQDAFRRVYARSTGHNNNQEVRFVTAGPLRGSVISVEPQDHLPYGYWIVVERLSPAGAYRQALRYRSATLYNDGNSLAVIDSEMPSIERRLGLWRPGMLLPTPDTSGGKPCPKPSMRHAELWCG